MSTQLAPRENALRAILIATIIVLQTSIFIPPASADGGVVQTFGGGLAVVVMPMQGETSASITVTLPRNSTFSTASFEISTDHQTDSPGNVWLDVDEDGFWEWAWNGTGHGDMSHQTIFSDGSSSSTIPISSNSSRGQGFILPPSATIASTSLNASFIPEIGGGFWQFGEILDMAIADIDSDSMPEVIALNRSTTGKMVGVIEWDTTGQLTSNWVTTCDNATEIRTGDIDGDGNEDVGLVNTNEAQMCVHFALTAGLGSVTNVSLPVGSLDAYLSDLDDNSYADLVSVDSNGDLNVRPWDSAQSAFGENQSQMIEANGTMGAPAMLAGLITGELHGAGSGESVVVFDNMGYATLWNWSGTSWIGPMNSFDGINTGASLHDFDSDGYNDLIGMIDGLVTLALYNGTGWNATTVFTAAVDNTIVGDYDGNGAMEMLTPDSGSSDGDDSTLTGSIELRHLNGTTINPVSTFELEPWTSPKQILLADLNGDGTDEHIVSVGEVQQGLFVSAWHSMSIDSNNDSMPEATVYGYSGDGQNGLPPLMWSDVENNISQAISPLLTTLGVAEDDYGNDLAYISPVISANGDGNAVLDNLEISYDVTLTIHKNPHITENLTNVFNKNMLAGNGTFNLALPFNSTSAGNIQLGNMIANWNPGAPSLAVPVQPQLILDNVNSTGVFFHWQNVSMWEGEDFLGFQVFRTSTGDEFNFTAPLFSGMINSTIDLDVTVGQSYDYAVRSMHQYGITSNLSTRLTATIPYPGPPPEVQGVIAGNLPNDDGGQIQVNWTKSMGDVDHYSIYVHELGSTGPSSFTLLGAVVNVSATANWTIVRKTSTVYDGVGNVVTPSSDMDHNTEYWIAVIGVNQYGNQSDSATSVGPVFARNDTVMPASISLDITMVDATSGESVDKLTRQSTYSNGTMVTLSSTLMLDGSIAPSQPVIIQITDGEVWFNYSGSTNSTGVFTPVNGEQWSNVVGQNALGGEITISTTYVGIIGSPNQQTIGSATQTTNAMVGVHATLNLLDDDIEVSLDGTAVMQLRMHTTNPVDQSLLEGTKLLWSVGNGSSNPSGSGEVIIDSGGNGGAAVLLSDGGWFNASLNPPSWLFINPTVENPEGEPWVNAILRPYPYTNGNGNNNQSTNNNQTQDSINQPVVNCESWAISNLYNQTDSTVTCTVTNPNNMSIDIDWSPSLWTAPVELGVFPPKLSLSIPTGNSIQFNLVSSPSENLTLPSGSSTFVIEGTVSAFGLPDLVLEYTVSYSVVDDIGLQNGEGNTTANNSGDVNDNQSSADDSMIQTVLIGSIAAVVGIIAIVMVIARLSRDDEDDWDVDDLDFDDPDEGYTSASRPMDLPSGAALEDIRPSRQRKKTPIIVEEISEEEAAADNPFDISRDVPEDSYEEEYDEEYEEEYEEEQQEGGDISVDEDGTEWWEDDDGIWWYRTTEMEDWAEYEE